MTNRRKSNWITWGSEFLLASVCCGSPCIRAINFFIKYIFCFRLVDTIQSDLLLQYSNSKFLLRLVITTRVNNFIFHFPLEFEFKGSYSNWNCELFVQIWIWIQFEWETKLQIRIPIISRKESFVSIFLSRFVLKLCFQLLNLVWLQSSVLTSCSTTISNLSEKWETRLRIRIRSKKESFEVAF